jgi:MFS family permease
VTDPAFGAGDAPATSGLRRINAAERRTILLYSGVIIVALSFINPSVGLFTIPLSFVLKNKLHLSANDLALFVLWASIPGYLSFAFGVARDFWNPFGRGDRGYFILFGAISALLLACLAFVNVSEPMLMACAMVMAISFLFMWGAWNGLASTIGQQHEMSGQMSAIWNFAGTSSIVVALVAGGVLSELLEVESANIAVRILFLIAAVLMALISGLGLWKPRAVFVGLSGHREQRRDFIADLNRLVRHWPIYPALIAWLLWNFSPGTTTVLQYYMSNELHASDAQWGDYNAMSTRLFHAYVCPVRLSQPEIFASKGCCGWGRGAGHRHRCSRFFSSIPRLGALIAAVPMGLARWHCNGRLYGPADSRLPQGVGRNHDDDVVEHVRAGGECGKLLGHGSLSISRRVRRLRRSPPRSSTR